MIRIGMKTLLTVVALSLTCATANAAVVFTYPPDGTGALIQSSWVFDAGSDADMYAYDDFTLGSTQTITEVRWRGGYQNFAAYGHVSNFSVTFYESIAGGSQPHVNNPQLPEVYLAYFLLNGVANETYVGTFGGMPMYDYSYVLQTPFLAQAGVKYWIRIEGYQSVFPDWGLARGTGGDGQHFAFSTGSAMFYFAPGDTAFKLLAAAMVLGDLNCDGVVNFGDINPFVLALTGQSGYQATFPACNFLNADVNGDGVVNFSDINPFVACLTNGACP